ncbi:hypothetical protein GCM10022228_08670 [Halomonas cibimaris]|uniref:PRC-barrel domain-containing protein n=1 Tax=Halomonas cibimaris TaxID=657012 RepID=A0ABP7LEK8_9GAMM
MRQHILMTSLGLCVLSISLGTQAQSTRPNANADPQGIYSADSIMEADVYIVNGSDKPIGEVEDILLDEQMKVSGLVVESGDILGLGGRELVVATPYFSLQTYADKEDDDVNRTEHRVMINATSEEMEQFPAYSRDWWQQAKANAKSAWQTTQQGAESAWQTTQKSAREIWQKTRQATSDMTEDSAN